MPPYSKTLMDHVVSFRNGGAMDSPDAVGRASLGGRAPRVAIYLRIRHSIVVEATFQTFGCGVSIACCSVLTEMVRGNTMEECREFDGATIAKALDGIPEDKQFCADMAIEALRNALDGVGGNS